MDEQTLKDEDIETGGTSTIPGEGDGDGTDGTDGDATDAGDGDGTDGSDMDGTDSDADAEDAG